MKGSGTRSDWLFGSCQQDLIRLFDKLQAIYRKSTFPRGEGLE